MIPLGRRFAVIGEQEAAPSDLLAIRVHPGIGWGVGWHPSTQAMARAMESYGLAHLSVADVGTGVGTLAMVAQLLDASKVYATELQRDRVAKANRNFQLNNMPIEAVQLRNLDFEVDIVVANLPDTSSTLEVLKYAKMGFIVHVNLCDVERVQEAAEAAGFTVLDVETVSNVGPKALVADNYIGHILVGRRL